MTDKRQDIDGLKGIAILAVVFYHLFDLLKSAHISESSIFNGGFLGVDIFFVISGFLITSSVFYKLSTDTFSVLDFYKRRFSRIVPPLLFVCIFTLIVGYFLLFPEVYKELNIEVANALLFIGNFRFANSGGYFSLDSSDKLLLHTWYLCVTIQFYVLFPLIVLLLKKVFSKERLPLAVTVIFVLLTVISVIASKNGKGYLLTQCRIFELFFGSVLYFYKDIIYRKVFSLNAVLPLTGELLGTVIIIISVFTVELQNGIWTVTTSLPTMLGTALAILSHNKNSVLRFPPLTVLGRCSYSLYLWHWPLFVFALRCGYTDTVLNCSVVILVILVFTALSYLLIEKRKFDYRVTLTLFLICFASYLYFHHNGGKNYFKDNDNLVTSRPALNLDKHYIPTIAYQKGDEVVWHEGLQKENPKIFFVGDSNLWHYHWYLKYVNKTPVYILARAANMSYGNYFTALKPLFNNTFKNKVDFYELYKSTLNKLADGDKVVLCGRWEVMYKDYCEENNLPLDKNSFEKYTDDVIKDLGEQIHAHKNLKFYIVGNSYVPNQSAVILSHLATSDGLYNYVINRKKAKFLTNYKDWMSVLVNEKIKKFCDSVSNATFIDRNVPLITNKGFLVIKDNEVIFRDYWHYTDFGGSLIAKYIMEQVEK